MKKVISILMCMMFIFAQIMLPVQNASAGASLWEHTFDEKVIWTSVTSVGTLLVGTKTALYSVDPDTGEVMWKRDDLIKTAPFSVKEAVGTPYLLVNDYQGGLSQHTKIYNLNIFTGVNAWEPQEMQGYSLGAYVVAEKKMAVVFVNGYLKDEKDSGVFMKAFNLDDGTMMWMTKFSDVNDVRLHVADFSSKFIAKIDLSGNNDPVVIGDNFYVPFLGVHCFDLATGTLKWAVPFNSTHKSYKRATSGIVIDGETIYSSSGAGVVYAIDKNTGTLKWESERVKSGLITQIVFANGKVFARLGGNFTGDGKNFVMDKPLGVVAYDQASGATLWEYKSAKEGITNMVVLPEQNVVLIADANGLIGVDAASSGKAEEKFRVPLKFVRSIGGTEMASAGVKALTGGIGGMLRAGASLANKKDRRDIPVALIKQDDGKVVVRGKQHIMLFDPSSQEIVWSNYFAAPGAGVFLVASMIAATAFSVAASNVSYASGQASMSSASSDIGQAYERMDRSLSKRYSASKSTNRSAYILTQVTDDSGESGAGLMAVNLQTGEPGKQVVLDDKKPDYSLDEITGLLFYTKSGETLVAYSLN